MNKGRMVKLAVFLAILLAVGVAAIMSHFGGGADNLCITEVCPHNVKAAHDEYGDYGSDYIEVYNPTGNRVNLLGYGLSDDSNELSKFLFPDINIEPGQALIVWSSEDKFPKEVWREDYVPSDVHGLGFNISDGEACILTDPEGKVISTAVVPVSLSDSDTISSARNGLDRFIVDEPTPYYVKDMIVHKEEKAIDEPLFSVDSGWFSGDFVLEISCSEGDVFYTLDGTDPDENDIKYEGPVTIGNRSDEENYYRNMSAAVVDKYFEPDFKVDKGTVVKAIAISDSGRSNIASRSYFVGLDEEEYEGISIMSLEVSPEDFFGYENGIYRSGSVEDSFSQKIDEEKADQSFPVANYAMKGRGWERDVTIDFFDENHKLAFTQASGIRIHGGNSVSLNQKSFNIYAREEYDGNEFFNYDFYGDGKKYDKLVLRNGGGEDVYLAKMRDVFNQSLAKDRAVGVQDAIPCVVFLNGEYWGLYNLQEKACDNYVWNHYGVPEDEVVVVKRKYQEYVPTDEEDESFVDEFVSLVDYAIDNDMSVEKNYRYIESKIDIQSLIDCYALKIYTGCIDAFYNNEAMWRSKYYGTGKYQDGKWRFLANDLDNSANMHTGWTSPDVDTFIEANWISKKGPLVDEGLLSSLIVNPEFKQRFVTSFMDMMNNNFAYEGLYRGLRERADVVRKQNVKSQQTFRGEFVIDNYPGEKDVEYPYEEDDFGYDIGLIELFYLQRPDYMTEYIKRDLDLQGKLFELWVLGELQPGVSVVVNTSELTGFSGEWCGKYFSDYPISLSVVRDKDTEFNGWFIDGKLVSLEDTYVIPAGFEGDEIVVEIR